MREFNYIYLIHEREFIKTKEKIYKIGKTTQENTLRFRQYPKGSVLILHITSKDCDEDEKTVILNFKEKFIHRPDIGTEYFEGNYVEMMAEIFAIIMVRFKEEEKKEKMDVEEPIYSHRPLSMIITHNFGDFEEEKNPLPFSGGLFEKLKMEESQEKMRVEKEKALKTKEKKERRIRKKK